MKKTFKTLLMALAIFGTTAAFTSCGEAESNGEEKTEENSEENAEEEHDHEGEHPSGGEHPE